MSEYWDLLDRNLNPTGKTIERTDDTVVPEGLLHIVVYILSVNKEGRILITKRDKSKPHGDMWEITGGSVLSGESPIDGAVRELHEETGLIARPDDLKFMGRIVRELSGCVHDFYIFYGDFDENDIRLQQGETSDFMIVSPEVIEKMAQSGEFLKFEYNRIRAVYQDIFFRRVN